MTDRMLHRLASAQLRTSVFTQHPLPAMLREPACRTGRPCGLGRTAPAVETIRHGADGLWADMRTQVRGPGVHIPLHRIEPLAQLPVRQPLAVGAGLGEPGVPERVQRPVAGYARKPAVRQAQRGLPVRRAGHRPRPHRVRAAQHGAAGGGNPRRQQGRGAQGPPHASGHGACRSRGGPEHEGRDGLRQGHEGGTRPEPEAAGRTAPQPAGARRARPGTEAGPQGRGAGHGEPGAYFTNMQPVRSRPQDPPTVADTIWVWPAGSRPTPAHRG